MSVHQKKRKKANVQDDHAKDSGVAHATNQEGRIKCAIIKWVKVIAIACAALFFLSLSVHFFLHILFHRNCFLIIWAITHQLYIGFPFILYLYNCFHVYSSSKQALRWCVCVCMSTLVDTNFKLHLSTNRWVYTIIWLQKITNWKLCCDFEKLISCKRNDANMQLDDYWNVYVSCHHKRKKWIYAQHLLHPIHHV